MSLAWDEGWEVDRYQEEIERSERERMAEGWGVPGGWARPVDPMCPEHRYGVVDGSCGVCLQEALSERVEGGMSPHGATVASRARSESAYGEGEAA